MRRFRVSRRRDVQQEQAARVSELLVDFLKAEVA